MIVTPKRFQGKAGRECLLEALKSLKIAKHDEIIAERLLEVATPMTFGTAKSASIIITEGEMSTDIYFLLSGTVSVRIKRKEVAIRRAGDHVGEMALIDPLHPRSASIIATERTEVARVSRQDFLAIARTHSEVWKQIALELSSRLRQRGTSIPKPNKVPVVFIGSAKKQIPVMNALARAIGSRQIHVKRWSKGIFGASLTTIETLESVIGNADFVVIILSADDPIFRDERIVEAPRDNCIFELGMGMGAIGRYRTLFLKENKELHLPSDLDGITYYSYDLKPRGLFERQIKDAARAIRIRVNSLKTK
jgi:CRP/FNR family cyclic AMP-dependent transcriptional regulator